jgi:hypothetical protein
MKKITLISFALVLSFCFTSCKKDQTCVCNITATGYSEKLTYTFQDTKKKAEETCDTYGANAKSSVVNTGFADASASCSLD